MGRPQDRQDGTARRSRNWLTISLVGGILAVIPVAIIFGASFLKKSNEGVEAQVKVATETRLALSAVPAESLPPGRSDLIAYVGNDGNVYTMAPDGSGRKQVTRDASADPAQRVIYQDLAWSPDGQYLSFTRISSDPPTTPLVYVPTAILYQPESEELRQLDPQGYVNPLVWTADSSALLYNREIHWDNTGKPTDPIYGVWKYDLATGQSCEAISPAHHDPLAVRSVSPEGRYITFNEIRYLDGPGPFGYFDLQTQTYHAWDQEGDLRPGSIDWSPDGQSLIFDKIDYGIRLGSQIWKADPNFEQIVAFTPSTKDFSAFLPRYAPTGDRIAYLYQQGLFIHPPELWAMNGDGSSRHRVASGNGLRSFTWSPDGKQLAYAVKVGKAYNVVVGDAAGIQSKTIADGGQPEWRPKGPGS